MKTIKYFSILILGSVLLSSSNPNRLGLGEIAPLQEYEMNGIDGNKHRLMDLRKSNGLLVVFSCNTCPFVLGWEHRYNYINDIANRENIGMVLVNSNEAKRLKDDSMDEMSKHAEEQNYGMPYVEDKDHMLADAFGAATTPDVFLFDSEMKLVYTGMINDMYENQDRAVKNQYLVNAMVEMSHGKEVSVPKTTSRGCTIKRL